MIVAEKMKRSREVALCAVTEHARLHGDGFHLSAIEVLRASRQLLEIDVVHVHTHISGVDAQDLCARLFSRVGQLHLFHRHL